MSSISCPLDLLYENPENRDGDCDSYFIFEKDAWSMKIPQANSGYAFITISPPTDIYSTPFPCLSGREPGTNDYLNFKFNPKVRTGGERVYATLRREHICGSKQPVAWGGHGIGYTPGRLFQSQKKKHIGIDERRQVSMLGEGPHFI